MGDGSGLSRGYYQRDRLHVLSARHGVLSGFLRVLPALFLVFTGRSQSNDPAQPNATNLMSLSLDQLLEVKVDSVYGASKYQQKLTEAPSAVSIVTDDDVKKYGYRTLTDILRGVRGLYVSYDRNYNYLGIRGFNRPGDYNSRALLLINGHRVNDSVYDTASIGTEFPLDVDLIDRVEIIRGPSSSIYGNNAFFGVINVITKEGRNLNGAEASGEAGSYGSYKGRFSYGKSFTNGVELLLSGSYNNSDGPGRLYFPAFDTASNNVNNGIAERADYDRSYQFFSSLSYRDFTLEGAFASREKGIPTGSYGVTFNNPRNRTIDEPGYLDLKYQHTFESDLEVTSRTYFDYYRYAGDYLYAPVVNKDFADGKRWGTEAQATKKLFDRHTFIFGAEYRNHFQQDQRNYDLDPYASYLDDRRHNDNWALYGQGEIAVLTNIALNAGVRYDNYGTSGDTLNPRLGLIMQPAEPTTFKVLYGRAFRAPNVYEML